MGLVYQNGGDFSTICEKIREATPGQSLGKILAHTKDAIRDLTIQHPYRIRSTRGRVDARIFRKLSVCEARF